MCNENYGSMNFFRFVGQTNALSSEKYVTIVTRCNSKIFGKFFEWRKSFSRNFDDFTKSKMKNFVLSNVHRFLLESFVEWRCRFKWNSIRCWTFVDSVERHRTIDIVTRHVRCRTNKMRIFNDFIFEFSRRNDRQVNNPKHEITTEEQLAFLTVRWWRNEIFR